MIYSFQALPVGAVTCALHGYWPPAVPVVGAVTGRPPFPVVGAVIGRPPFSIVGVVIGRPQRAEIYRLHHEEETQDENKKEGQQLDSLA